MSMHLALQDSGLGSDDDDEWDLEALFADNLGVASWHDDHSFEDLALVDVPNHKGLASLLRRKVVTVMFLIVELEEGETDPVYVQCCFLACK